MKETILKPKKLGRPSFKKDAERISLTLSGPARAYITSLARLKGTSRTQVVEDLVEAHRNASKDQNS